MKTGNIGVFLLALIAALMLQVNTCEAAVSCTSDINNKLIGIEFVADSCPTESNQTLHYIETAIQCSNGSVALFAHYGDDITTPGFLVYYWATLNGYRVFGNDLGNHIIAVNTNFGSSPLDTIDGKQMSDFQGGGFYLNVFDKILYPESVSNDSDNDHYLICDDCNDADPLINPTAAEICNDDLDNNCDGQKDCQDTACAADPTCTASVEINPADFPRDCRLELK